jgi:hypothetical protein
MHHEESTAVPSSARAFEGKLSERKFEIERG